jgi:hypothetical protein
VIVDVGQELGGHALLSKSLHGARRAKSARVRDADDSNSNNGVHDGWQDFDASILNGKDEGRGLGVGSRRVQQPVVIGPEDQADNEEVDNVKEGDTPKHLLGCRGDRLAGVRRLGGGETDQLGATKRKGGYDKDTSKSIESISEGARILPEFAANVTPITDAASVDDDAEDDETRASRDLDHAEDEFD